LKKKFLKGDMVFDTSVLVEIALATDDGREIIDEIVEGNITPYTTTLNVTEALYILCRLLGLEEARRRIGLIVNSKCFEIVSSDNVSLEAAECKCMFPVSIVDCHTLALSKKYGKPPLFYKVEKEFKRIVGKLESWIRNKIYFIVNSS